MKNLIIIFSIFFLLLACKREKIWFNDTTVEGYLLDSATFEPFKDDIKVHLFRYHTKGMIFPTNEMKIIKTRYPDDNGHFIFKFNSVRERAYFVFIDYQHDIEYKEYINNKTIMTSEIDIDSVIKYKNIYFKKK